MNEPKYHIADKLCHVADHSLRMFVVAVLTEECPGGTQYHYQCRTVTGDNHSHQLTKFNEVELIEIPSKVTLADRLREMKSAAIEAGDMELASQIRESEKRITGK